MTLHARYNYAPGTRVSLGTGTSELLGKTQEGYELMDSETGEVGIIPFSTFTELLKKSEIEISDGGFATNVVSLRQGGRQVAEQFSARSKKNGEFHYAISVASAELRREIRKNTGNFNYQLKIRDLDEPENRKYIAKVASKHFQNTVRTTKSRGGQNTDWVLYDGRTLRKYLKIFDSAGSEDDLIALLATREHRKGNRSPRIDEPVKQLMTQAWDTFGLDSKGLSVANVWDYLATLIHDENKLRRSNKLKELPLPSQKTLKAHRDYLLLPTEVMVAMKGENYTRNKRGRGSTDIRALLVGEMAYIDECKLSLITTAKERGFWERLSDEDRMALEKIDEFVQQRLHLLLMIDVASSMPLAWVLSDKPKAEATLALLRMATRDKTREKIKYGCQGDPAPAMGIGSIMSDNGSGLRNKVVIGAALGLGSRYVVGRTYASTDRTNVERSFGTLESQVIKLIHGYTGRRPGELPSYDANANGVLVTEELHGILTRYFIDEYPSRRHMGIGMGGRRPAEVLKELNETRGLFRPIDEDRRRIHLGLEQSLTPTDEGVRAFSGIWYNSDEFQRAVERHPKTKVAVFIDPDNLTHATAVIPNEEQLFRLRLQITAFADLTLPEALELLQAYRRENPDVSEIHEDRIISTRKKRYAELNKIGVEHGLSRSYSTIEELKAMAERVFSGARVVPSPRKAPTLQSGEISAGTDNPEEFSLGSGLRAKVAGDAPGLAASTPGPITQKAAAAPQDAAATEKTKLTSKNDKNRPMGRPKKKGKFA